MGHAPHSSTCEPKPLARSRASQVDEAQRDAQQRRSMRSLIECGSVPAVTPYASTRLHDHVACLSCTGNGCALVLVDCTHLFDAHQKAVLLGSSGETGR